MQDDVVIEVSGPLFDRVHAALEEFRPHIQADGGDVRLLEIEDGTIAIVELQGRCVGCPMSEITIRHGIEAGLRTLVPEIMAVDVAPSPDVQPRRFRDVLDAATITP